MGKSRSDRREASGEVTNLFAKGTLVGCRVLMRVSMELALEKEAQGKWRRVFYDGGALAGFQPYAQARSQKPAASNPGGSLDGSPPTITLTEVQMNAGEFGASRTRGMPEWKRERRQRRIKEKYCHVIAPEDAIERAIEKVRLWPYPASRVDDGSGEAVFGDKAIRVYPHTKRAGGR